MFMFSPVFYHVFGDMLIITTTSYTGTSLTALPPELTSFQRCAKVYIMSPHRNAGGVIKGSYLFALVCFPSQPLCGDSKYMSSLYIIYNYF